MRIGKKFTIYLLSSIFLVLSAISVYSQPNLLLPGNNLDCVRKDTIAFGWTLDPAANDYQITISENSDMSSPVFQALTGNTIQISHGVPKSGQLYYWRVATIINGTPQTYNYSVTWSFTTKKAPPALTAPINNSNCSPISTTFSWQSITNATYTLQISLSKQFTTYVLNKSNIAANSFIDSLPSYNTKYFWRVYAAYGTCNTDYSAVDSFTTQNTPPTLTSPSNNVNAQSVDGMRFNWTIPVAPPSYTLQFAIDSTFAVVITDHSVTTNTDTLSNFSNNTKYYWRVKADYVGCSTSWSPVWKFLTKHETPKNLLPVNDSMCVPMSMRFKWDAITAATYYRLQVCELPDFAKPVLDSAKININYLDYTVPKGNQRYYWRVMVQDAVNYGDWSPTLDFISATDFSQKMLPADGDTNQNISVIFQWKKTSADSYERIQIADDKNFTFSSIRFDLKSLAYDTTKVTFTNTDFYKTFYWRISSNNHLGTCNSVWSGAWSFSTVLLPPVLSIPANNAVNQPVDVTFEWQPVVGALRYELSLASDISFTKIVTGKQGIYGTKLYVPGLSSSTNYYWRVNAVNDFGTSVWSKIFKFRTGTKALNVPVQLSPANGSDKLPVSKVTLSWNTVPSAKYYYVQINDKNDFTKKPLIDVPDCITNSYDLTTLNNNTTYYWRIKATNDSASSDWSTVWAFSSVIQVPSNPAILSSPANNAEGVPTDLTFEWAIVTNAENYDFQLSTDSQFGSFIINDTMVISNLRYVSNTLKNLQTYYWRARGKNYAGYGPWSDTWKFTTIFTSVDDYAFIFNVSLIPNPINDLSTLAITLPKDSRVKIDIVNLLGVKVDEIANGEITSGNHSFIINSGKFENGIYFCNFDIDGKSFIKKFVIAK